ncbi:MAG: hypothetical protein HN368_08230 [Spirochaetales bacterium]|nr:hypothetical protein [Spirochaetales bacterium]
MKNPEIRKLQDDIQGIRRAIDLGSSAFKQIYAARNFRFLFLTASLGTTILVLLYAFIDSMGLFGKSSGMWIMAISAGLLWLFLFSYKIRITKKAADRIGLTLNWLGLFKEQMSSRIWLSVIPTLFILVLLPFRDQAAWSASDIAAYVGIVLGLVLNLIGVLISEREYLFCGFWMIAAGLLFFFLLSLPAHLVYGLVLSPACLLFFITATLSRRD